MSKGQISANDTLEAEKSFEKFLGLTKQYLPSEKDLVVRWSIKSVWIAEVFYKKNQAKLGVIDLSLPVELQFYQLGQQILGLKGGDEQEAKAKT